MLLKISDVIIQLKDGSLPDIANFFEGARFFREPKSYEGKELLPLRDQEISLLLFTEYTLPGTKIGINDVREAEILL